MKESDLFRLGKPAFCLVAMGDSDYENLYLRLTGLPRPAVIRKVRGKKSQTVNGFFDEIAAALQFPYYFGENWAAFEECIVDLEWIEGDAYLLMVSNASLLLSAEDAEDFRILIRILGQANVEWLTPNQFFPRQRQPTLFRILFQCSEADTLLFSERLQSVGSEFETFEPGS